MARKPTVRWNIYEAKHGIDAKCIQTSSKHLKTRMQYDNIILHAILSKFHVEHTQNGATVQHTHTTQVIATICPKQQLGILQASKQYTTAPQHENKRHGHDVQVKHNKT